MSHPVRSAVAAMAPTVLSLTAAVSLAACSSSNVPGAVASTTTAPPLPADSPCALVGAQQVGSVVGNAVGAPTAVNHGSTSTCTYRAADTARSVIVEYEAGVSTSSFVNAQQAFELQYGQTISISGLGDQAYVGVATSGNRSTYTVVTLVGTTQVVVIGSASRQKVESLAEVVLSALYAHRSSSGSTTSSTAGPVPASRG